MDQQRQTFTCGECGKTMYQECIFKMHQRSHKISGKYKCNFCEKKFLFKTTLKSHLLSHDQANETSESSSKKTKNGDVLTGSLNGDEFCSFDILPESEKSKMNKNKSSSSNKETETRVQKLKPNFSGTVQPKSIESNENICNSHHLKTKTVYVCSCCQKKFASLEFARNHLALCYNYQKEFESTDDKHQIFIDRVKDPDKVDEIINSFIYSVSVGELRKLSKNLNLPMQDSKKKTLIFYCAKCQTNYENETALLYHVKDCTRKAPKLWCKECNVNFETQNLLADHISRMGHEKLTKDVASSLTKKKEHGFIEKEGSVVSHMCTKCDIVLPTLNDYKAHRESKHAGTYCITEDEGQYECAHCGSVFTSKAFLYRHMTWHKSPEEKKPKVINDSLLPDPVTKKWNCSKCKKSYSNKSNLVRHLSLHNEEKKNHMCPFCGRIFQYQRYLQHHIMYLHRLSEEKKNVCDICQATFTTKHSLKRHQQLHTGETEAQRKEKCKYCDKKFKWKEDLRVHLRTHTNERPFPCEKCHYRAKSFHNLVRHNRIIHEKPNKKGGHLETS